MSLDVLLKKIEEEYRQKAAALEAEARRETDEIINSGRREADRESARQWEKTEARLRRGFDQELAKIRVESKKKVLTCRRQLLDDLFAKAVDELVDGDQEAYRIFLARSITGAIVTGREEIILTARDRERYGKEVLDAVRAHCRKAKLASEVFLAEKAADFRGGAVLREGARSVDLTVPTLIEMKRADLEVTLGRRLSAREDS